MTAHHKVRYLQANVNHCKAAQALLCHHLAEKDVDFAAIAEPYRVQDHPRWVQDLDGAAALTWTDNARTKPAPIDVRWRAHGHVAINWGDTIIVSCYISPKRQSSLRDLP